MTGTVPPPAGCLEPGRARAAVAAVAAACSGHVGLAARHLGTGEEVTWHPEAVVQTASSVKVAIHVAAEYGVPVVLVTGDDQTCADAADYAPQAVTVPVKECVSRYAAVCRPPEVTAAAITAAAARAAKLARRRPSGRPGVPGEDGVAAGPGFTVEIEVDASQLAQAAAIVPTVRRTGDRRVSYHSATAWEMIRCFKTVTTMIAAATEDTYG